ncbi:MAG: SHOCT-like domain-containing protein [Bacillota bacterium]
MSEERVRILKMLEEGKIGVDEAENLLQSLNNRPKKTESQNKVKFIKIVVEEGNEEKVNISVPISLAKSLLKFIPKSARESLDENEINIQEIIDAVENVDGPSTLVDINDNEDHVKVRLE